MMGIRPRMLILQPIVSIGGIALALLGIVRSLKNKMDVIVAVPGEGWLTAVLEAENVSFFVTPGLRTLWNIPRQAAAFHDVSWIQDRLLMKRSARVVFKLCREQQPDCVYLNSAVFAHLAPAIKSAVDVPVCMHVREHWEDHWFDPRTWLKKHYFRSIDHVVSITMANAEQIGYHGPVSVVHDWSAFPKDNSATSVSPRFGMPEKRKIFLVPGGKTRNKGTLTVLQSCQYLQSRDVTLLVLGGASDMQMPRLKKWLWRRLTFLVKHCAYSARVERLASELGTDRVVMAPWMQDPSDVFRCAYAVLCPFSEPHFSKAVIDAAAAGRPAIASDWPEIAESIIQGKTGLLVSPFDAREWAHAIDRLAADVQFADQLGQAARELAKNHFSEKGNMIRLNEVLNELLVTVAGDKDVYRDGWM